MNSAKWQAIRQPPRKGNIIGRTKSDNVELDDAGPRKSHKSLTTIVDAAGTEHDILRDNMPFGRPGQGEYGTYFIGYARHLWVIEQMLRNMFVGVPEGEYDRILDFSKPVTGAAFSSRRPIRCSKILAERRPMLGTATNIHLRAERPDY